MVKAGHGRIVNIASTAAKKGFKYTAAYCASKHALLGLTRALALELAPEGRHHQRGVPRVDGHRHARRPAWSASPRAPAAARPRRRRRWRS